MHKITIKFRDNVASILVGAIELIYSSRLPMDSKPIKKYRTLAEILKDYDGNLVKNAMVGMLFLGGFLFTVEGIKFLSLKNMIYGYQKTCIEVTMSDLRATRGFFLTTPRKVESWKRCR